jgi:O-antigen/teichoic acid export membrane protein
MFSVFSSYGKERIAEINRILDRYLIWSSALYVAGCAIFWFGGSYLLERLTGAEDIRLLFEVTLIILIGNASFGLAEPFVRAFWGLGDLAVTLRIKLLQPLANIALILALSGLTPIYRFSWSFSIAFALSAVVMVAVFKLRYGGVHQG